ncbi:alpha-2-macroglobulin domain protein, partial [hydrothermal vent metagenome]
GGFDGEYKLPDDATLGQYYVQIQWDNKHRVGGGGRFRVEEYKKPEFEVTIDAPKEPVMLGEKITATITAKYYFGAPVTHAKVKYKITRTNYNQQWYPYAKWDWFYGPGYWWFADNYDFYPGWRIWNSCFRPIPPWWGHRSDPPEVVLEREVEIGEDGIVKVEIDTAIAKAVHSDQDHKYQITAEVVDQSRRTIVGSGQVLVARKPFKVFAWMNNGHYETGDTAVASFKAQTLDNKPIKGNGKLTLFKVHYDKKGKLTEKELFTVALNTNEQGEAKHKFKVPNAGQFRISYKVTDTKKHTIEGGYLFNVIGKDDNGSGYKFNDLELVLDKREYKPGDKVKVLINTNRENSTVLLFVRPTNGIYSKPTVIRLDGKNNVHEITIAKKDMPNFFVEGITVSNGKLHSITREVIVPPEKRIAKIEVLPSSKDYRPGANAKINLKLTDIDGKPFVGSTVVSIYDKSVEYISGGSNIPEIRAFFWKWRRSHYPQTESNLVRYFGNLLKNGETSMGNIGRFGHLVTNLNLSSAGKKNADKQDDAKDAKGEAESAAEFGEGKSLNRRKENNKKSKSPPRGYVEKQQDGGGEGSAGSKTVEPVIRKNFADTALWVGAITTNDDGTAEVSLKMPENLTTWKIRVWSMGHGTRVGQGEAEVVTSKNLIIRLQAPRFFVETDEVVLTANVHNYLKTEKTAQVVLALQGDTLKPMGSLTQTVKIPAGGEAKVDWRVKVIKEGTATITMKALTDEESDAMQMKFPVYVHGMLKMESFTGVIRPGKSSATVTVSVPKERKPEQSRLEVRYSPTLAGAMVDALPYLTSYPYKTSDTTLHRFLPTVITQNILKRMGLNLKEIEKKRTNLNAQEIGDDKERAKRWKRYKHNPVFNEAEVQKMVKQGLKDLTSMQMADGGWGWFYGYGSRSSAYQTALVVHGLHIAKQNDIALVPNMIQRGETWLKNHQNRQVQLLKNKAIWDAMSKKEKEKNRGFKYKTHADNLDAFVYMVLAEANVLDDNMNAFLYRDRTKLSVHAKAMFGLALHKQHDTKKLKMIMQNIDQFLVQDNENDTAYLKLPGTHWWYWYGSDIEVNAYYLKLLAKTNPQGEKAARLAKYIINNRRYGTYWRSTRDTAVAIEALAEYMQKSGEDKPDMTVQVFYDGQKMKEVKINKENLFSFDNRFVITGLAVAEGKHKIELKRTGKGRLYFNAYMTNFTKEDFITKAGLEIKVNRKFYQLIRDDKTEHVAGSRGQAVGQKVEKYKRKELANLATIKAGDLIEVELEIDSKNDYEKIIFEDMKVAGFEPVDLRSGYNSNSMGAYMELRDERVTFFVENLAHGKHSVSYKLRAEIPGKYSALPAKGSGMYAPELRANSDEWKVKIKDVDLIHVKAARK